MKKQDTPGEDNVEILRRRVQNEQRDFENHWLWRDIGSSPRDFFAMVDDYVARSGIPPEEWKLKLTEAKHRLEQTTRATYSTRRHENLPTFGLKA